jgi:outer membrane immunogenic protein
MRKIVLVIACLALSAQGLRAQNNDTHFNAGVGLHGWGIPLYASYDWGFRGDFNLGVGGSLSLAGDGNDGRPDGLAMGAGFFSQWYADRILDIPSEFDLYGGLGIFYYGYKNGNDLDLNGFIGGRYYFNDNLGVNLELGGGSALTGGKIGFSWQL